ncbi:MAG: glutamine--fructose-6-phosphate transaminase (isomerizing) [Chitinophagales bacterium]|nr:glutamine--fructose-6-phosphate transaminase (isomerizing) [Chitinophagales bacterium]
MCGIVAYIGTRDAYPILIKGLKRLEYRGYDSAGVALMKDQKISLIKQKGKVSELEELATKSDVTGTLGIGHTRWATHGPPSQINSHPHLSNNGDIAVIHNGIIENFQSIKEELTRRGYQFISDTDTEVLAHLIEEVQKNEKCNLDKAVRLALNEVTGAYAIAVFSKKEPDILIGARKGSPLIVGIGKNEFFLASDASPVIEYTKKVVYINDEEMVTLNRSGDFELKTIQNQEKTPYIHELELNLESIEKGGYEHFMLKEIHEQPKSIYDSIRGRVDIENGLIKLGGLEEYKDRIMASRRIIIVACGTSWHAGLLAEYMIEDLARANVEVEYASEFRYRNPVIDEDDIIIAISQSGETADTLAAIEMAKQKGCLILGVCNVVGSSIPRASHAGCYTHAGPEIGVASTKAFTAQVSVLFLIALWIANNKSTLSKTRIKQLLKELDSLPSKIESLLKSCEEKVKTIAHNYKDARNFLYLGRGYNFPAALEGALKLKEISYIHAEGYPAAEMKHGPIALIDEEMPVVFLVNNISSHEKTLSNVQEVAARKGQVIAIARHGDAQIKKLAKHVIEVPDTEDCLSPILASIPLQLLSYYTAIERGCNVDQPRNLAKSVTVE